MPWYQQLGLGICGGMVVGGVFYLAGWVLDWYGHRKWLRERDEPRDESGD